ncbi:MAG: CRISPR-associated endonuclease Cas4g/Cas1g [Acidimicrobiia bacterium]
MNREPLPAQMEGEEGPELLPVRMLNEYAYCPRLFHLMHVEGRWADNEYTVDGQVVHGRINKRDELLPDPEQPHDNGPDGSVGIDREGDPPPRVARSVSLSSDRLGITAKLDLVSTVGNEATPVDTKRGRVPNVPERCYEPERVQLMAQGLLLREHGYRTEHGVIYFAGSRTRVEVPFTAELEARALHLIQQARQASLQKSLPDPLEDSPKCNKCSLNGICLPDETLALRRVPVDPVAPEVRRLYPPRDDALPLYVQEQGASVGKSRGTLVVRKKEDLLARVRLKEVSQLVLCGNVGVTAQTIHLLCEAGIPIVHLSQGHWFYGVTHGITLRNAYDRAAQFRAAEDPSRVLSFARSVVAAKGSNQRTLLRRNLRDRAAHALKSMSRLLGQVDSATSTESLLGLEGSLAAHYFANFAQMLRPRDIDIEWSFHNRNKRPPRDPVNAMLSFAYALLAKECSVALLGEGLDPWWGLYHQPRHGRPALALDLMEEFRPVVADSAVITAVNTGMVVARDFTRAASGCMLNDSGRKALIRAYEARLDQFVTHPVFGYRCAWRAVIRVQARLLARWLRGDVPNYAGMVTR